MSLMSLEGHVLLALIAMQSNERIIGNNATE